MSDVFDIRSTINGIDKNKLITSGNAIYPFVTRTEFDPNGINLYVPEQQKPINKGNCISIGLDTQTVFYQFNDFYTGQNIQILRYKGINKYNGLFVCMVIKFIIKQLYSWGGNGATLSRLLLTKIRLPSTNNEPDWKYMENYIKSLPNSDLI